MTATKLCLFTLCAAFVSAAAIVPGARAVAQTCAGDCNTDGSVAINEIIRGVRIALGDAPIGDCEAMDADANGVVAVNEVVAAVGRTLQGCGGPVPPTRTPTRTPTPEPTKSDAAALVEAARVATDAILRLFDLQASIGTTVSVAGRARAAAGGAAGISGCQQLDCPLFGSQEVCCSDTQFSQFFDRCTFDDALGRVSLTGLYVLDSDTADVCTGAIPVGASFAASLSSFTHDVIFPNASFSRTFQELSEIFEVTPGGCTVRQPEQFGFGVRGDGRQFIDGELQQFQSDRFGNVLANTETNVRGLGIEAGSKGEPDDCTVSAAVRGSLSNADVRVGLQFAADFTGFHADQRRQAGALVLGLNGTIGADCVGNVTLSTVEPVRIAPGDTCFTAGRLEAQTENGTLSVTYTEGAGLDFDFGADGSIDQRFATCTDVPADKCRTKLVGLCGACAELNQCQTGLGCLPCSTNCSGDTNRCALFDTFVTCEDGVF